jgi:hypothetical protein
MNINKKTMLKTLKIYAAIAFFLSAYACSKAVINKNDFKGKGDYTHTLEEEKDISFPLDAETPQSLSSIQIFENDSCRYFTFLNEFNNSVYFYDYDSQEIVNQIKFQKEGPHGTSRKVLGHYVSSMDSIFLFSYVTKYLYLFNSNSELIDKYHTQPVRKRYLPASFPNNGTSMFLYNNKMYLIGHIGGEYVDEDSLNRPIVTVQNLLDKNVSYKMGYPSSYREGNWGGAQFRRCKWDFNPKKNRFIFSFPNDHYIYTSDLQTNTEKHYAGSKFSGNIKSLDVPKGGRKNKPRRRRLFATNPTYLSVVYDPFRDVYYRFAQQALKEYNDETDNCFYKPFSIIIMDNAFNIIGEKKMNLDKYSQSPYCYFVTREGLNLCHESDNEDEIKFTIFKLKNI